MTKLKNLIDLKKIHECIAPGGVLRNIDIGVAEIGEIDIPSNLPIKDVVPEEIERKCPYRHCVHDLHCTISGFKNCNFTFNNSDKYKNCEYYKAEVLKRLNSPTKEK